ncbi:MAG: flagellar protein export ATPase FliI [Bacteroidetes bacterium]|nr:flagellar protein export ATPase FliI [Bacteroidota bacterium]
MLSQKSEHFLHLIRRKDLLKMNGRVTKVIGLVIESNGPHASIGEVCIVKSKDDVELSLCEVVGFRENKVLSMVLGEASNISPGCEIVSTGRPLTARVGEALLGRVIDGLGNPLDGKGPIMATEERSIYNAPPNPLERKRITKPIATGIRSIDSLRTLGKGQRVGIFAGSGVGKSVTMGMIARNTSADVNVICLVGERGREVGEFIERELGPEGLKRSVVIVATSDKSALIRIKSVFIATTIAEYFRDKGQDVMLMMDSITRLAMSQREVGLAIGEPPTTKGYTPSVFAMLPKVLERAGTAAKGSITGLYTVLVEGDDMNDPVADTVRSILDGHIVLSRRLAAGGHYPAIDVLGSVSRVMTSVTTDEHRALVQKFLDTMATYAEAEDLINIGAYAKGSNPKIDESIKRIESYRKFLKQQEHDHCTFEDSLSRLSTVVSRPLEEKHDVK